MGDECFGYVQRTTGGSSNFTLTFTDCNFTIGKTACRPEGGYFSATGTINNLSTCNLVIQGSNDKKSTVTIENTDRPKVFLISQNPDYIDYCVSLANKLRAEGIACETEYTGRSIKAQFKFADKQKAEYVIVIGGSEIENGECEVKRQSDGNREKISIDSLVEYFQNN